MEAKITITLEVDPKLGPIAREAMNEALGELFRLAETPVDKISLTLAVLAEDDAGIHAVEQKIGRALMDVPQRVDITIKTAVERGVERKRRDARPMDTLWAPRTPSQPEVTA